MIKNLNTLDGFDNKSYLKFSNPSVIEKDLRTLSGILSGIKSDNVISFIELRALNEWIVECKIYENKQPYKEVIELIRTALDDDILTKDEMDNIIWLCNIYTERVGYYDLLTAGIQKMQGVVKGIIVDREINDTEIRYLDRWLEDNAYLKNTWPYDELYNITTKIINRKGLSKDEHDAVLGFCEALVGKNNNIETADLVSSLKTGYYQIDPDIVIPDNTFCITGLSQRFKRREIAEKIELYGGYITNSISAKTNYLLVCDAKNACWAFTCYGRKIEQAINLRKSGGKLVIVHEYDFFDALENYK